MMTLADLLKQPLTVIHDKAGYARKYRPKRPAGVEDELNIGNTPDQPLEVDEVPKGIFAVPELDVTANLGDGYENREYPLTVRVHYFPVEQIRHDIGAEPENVRVIRVDGDSMAPTLETGDRIMVDITRRRPSPPGLFVVHDGMGLIVKRLEFILNSDPPSVRIVSDNNRYEPRVLTVAEAHIMGRVIWVARRM